MPTLSEPIHMDYVGGGDNMPYVTAVQFFQRRVFADSCSKSECVVAQQIRRHDAFLRDQPLALQLLPDPSERANPSKRRWECLMYRARNILFPGPRKRRYPFQVSPLQAKQLPRLHDSILQDLPHPGDCRDDRLPWRSLALEYALQVHILLDEVKKARSDAHRVDH